MSTLEAAMVLTNVSTAPETGADLISAFISKHCQPHVFTVTGGACAFILDAIGRNPDTDYVCFQHEQATAMAADAVWRLTGKLGVTVSTSGPGATNLITGIACSWFDSVPSFHITGQVNDAESRAALGVNARQIGFQETDIVSMVRPITKFAIQVHSVEELSDALRDAYLAAVSGRMGPVLIDVPINVQKQVVTKEIWEKTIAPLPPHESLLPINWHQIHDLLHQADRPLVIIGGGAFLAGTAREIQDWCEKNGLPYISSWSAMPHLDRAAPLYFGSQGVYGSRLANWMVQSADRILVLGSRLDNRQRTGNPVAYAPFARLLVLDIDREELGKYSNSSNYSVQCADLAFWRSNSESFDELPDAWHFWRKSIEERKLSTDSGTSISVHQGQLNPYDAIKRIQDLFPPKSIVVADTGANLCWVYQAYKSDDSFLFSAVGNSPMGYSLPAAIGSKIVKPNSPVLCIIGDGGLQMNVQELQTVAHYQLPIVIIIMNNRGYGIIKQFQDAYFEGRHEATGRGYSTPDFGRIADAYGLPYVQVCNLKDFEAIELPDGPLVIDVMIPQGALITPKIEMDRFLHDQFPYAEDPEGFGLPYEYPARPSELSGTPGPTV